VSKPPKKKRRGKPTGKKKFVGENKSISKTETERTPLYPMRLNKFIAHSGICSRRTAAEYVKAGDVKLNGKVETNPAVLVQYDDKVMYKGKPVIKRKKNIYLLLNKPKNVITTMNDERDRRTVWNMVEKKVKDRIYPVGRLDRATTGLLLMTNDGLLAKKLSHPSHGVKKFYEVELDRPCKKTDLEKIRKGLILEDGKAEVDGLDYIKAKGKKHLGIEIHMGKNRIIRRIFEHLDYTVVKLDRVYYAGLTKKDLPRGWSRFLTKKEIIMLKHFT